MHPLKSLAIALALGASSLPSYAHHSFAMFDMSRKSNVHGTVKSVEWASPHVWLWVTVNADGAAPATYGFESVSPGQLLRDFGWNRHDLNVGDKVVVDYFPLRSGNTGGNLYQVTLPNGKILRTRHPGSDAVDAPGAPAQPSSSSR
jgi:hypothetical protein